MIHTKAIKIQNMKKHQTMSYEHKFTMDQGRKIVDSSLKLQQPQYTLSYQQVLHSLDATMVRYQDFGYCVITGTSTIGLFLALFFCRMLSVLLISFKTVWECMSQQYLPSSQLAKWSAANNQPITFYYIIDTPHSTDKQGQQQTKGISTSNDAAAENTINLQYNCVKM